MGFHICEYCGIGDSAYNFFPHTSSGDVTLCFASGRSWGMPDMVLHYIADHKWLPSPLFVDDVVNSELLGGERLQTKSPQTPIGYLSGEFTKGDVPEGFVERLKSLMEQAAQSGNRIQYRGSDLSQLVDPPNYSD